MDVASVVVGAEPGRVAGAAGAGFLGGRASAAEAENATAAPVRRFVPSLAEHQTGITASPVPSLSLMAAFDCVAPDADALAECLQELTAEIRTLMAGDAVPQRAAAYPPVDSGLLGEHPLPDNLSVVVSVGASLLDGRYGVSERRPRELVEMPFVANDRLDPARSHGDLLLTIEAEHPDTVQFALRQLMRRTREWLVVRWVLDGWTRGTSATDGSVSTSRNLMGFKDGTANLDTTDAGEVDAFVWVGADAADEPDWTVGGSYHVVRVIRMFVEF